MHERALVRRNLRFSMHNPKVCRVSPGKKDTVDLVVFRDCSSFESSGAWNLVLNVSLLHPVWWLPQV